MLNFALRRLLEEQNFHKIYNGLIDLLGSSRLDPLTFLLSRLLFGVSIYPQIL